jgi:ribonucleotide reductase alpha subunit
MINPQQLETYRQALEAWKTAAKEAQHVKDNLYNVNTAGGQQDMYIITDQELQYLQKENDLYQRLADAARQL